MRTIFQVLSWIMLVGTIVPSILFYLDKVSLNQMIVAMNIVMVGWFVVTPLWMGRKVPQQAASA